VRSDAKASSAGSTLGRGIGLGSLDRGANATRGASLTFSGSGAPSGGHLGLLAFALFVLLAAMALLAAPARAVAPTIAATWSEDVVYTEAIVKSEINPQGLATTYHFEYGPTEAYGSETPELAAGSGSSNVKVGRFIEGLETGTTYHYRVVATNGDGATAGADHTFTTYRPPAPDTDCPNQVFRYGPSASLSDCRAYEMVSPVDKAGKAIEVAGGPFGETGTDGIRQSAPDGGKLTYSSKYAFGDSPSGQFVNQYMATRTASGWTTHGINSPQGTTIFDPGFTLDELGHYFLAFTPDLSSAWVRDYNKVPLALGGREGFPNLYRRDNTAETYEAITTVAPLAGSGKYLSEVRGFTDDGSRVFLNVARPLTADAALNANHQVYEYSGGALELLSVLPGGAADPDHSYLGSAEVGGGGTPWWNSLDNAVSDDGSRAFWTSSVTESPFGVGKIFVRIDGETTVPVSESVSTEPSQFWTAAADGSSVLFTVEAGPLNGNLYVFDVDAGTSTLIAGEVAGVAAAADDLSRVYFVSDEDLAAGAVAGEPNLYVREGGTVALIGTLAAGDSSRVVENRSVLHTARATPDGSHLVFMSKSSLTGYDSIEAPTGKLVDQVFLYDADADELVCVSCNPSGARPSGSGSSGDALGSGSLLNGAAAEVAAWVPTWENSLRELRALSVGGDRVFFNSFDALVPHDTNGVQDLYQWEAPGTGGCDAGDPEFSASNGGCVALLSTGQSPAPSEFTEASVNGDSVFFETESSIDPDDPGLNDVYVVRVNGGYPRSAPAAPCVGDACQIIPAGPNDPTPASASFRGAGDPAPAKARRRCRARGRKAGEASAAAKRKAAKRCRRANRRAAR
jgi:hypothetical protein